MWSSVWSSTIAFEDQKFPKTQNNSQQIQSEAPKAIQSNNLAQQIYQNLFIFNAVWLETKQSKTASNSLNFQQIFSKKSWFQSLLILLSTQHCEIDAMRRIKKICSIKISSTLLIFIWCFCSRFCWCARFFFGKYKIIWVKKELLKFNTA